MLDTADGNVVNGTFDMDHGFEFRDRIFWANRITLYSGNGTSKPTLLESGRGYSRPTTGAGGSESWFDDFLTYSFTEPNEYFIEISAWYPYKLTGLPNGVDYELNISLEEHDVDNFLFKPNFAHEQEPNQSKESNDIGSFAQILDGNEGDDGDNFFTFPDEEIGNTHLQDTDTPGRITDGTPYVRIKGTGDYTDDYYLFHINEEMLTGAADDISTANTINRDEGETYYTAATLTLNSTEVRAGDEWTIYIDGRTFETGVQSYSYQAVQGDTLNDVAAGLQSAIEETTTNRFVLSVVGDSLTLGQTDAGFYLGDDSHDSGLTQKRHDAATVTRTTTTRNKTDDSDIELTKATIRLHGTPVVDEIWTITIGGTPVPHTVTTGQSLANVADDLETAIGGLATVARSHDSGFEILDLTGISGGHAVISVDISGIAPSGAAEIKGTPVNADEAVTPWYDVTYTLTGNVGKSETWTVTINDSDYSVVASDYHSLNEMAAFLDTAVGSAFNATATNNTLTLTNTTSFTTDLSILEYTGNTATNSTTATSVSVLLDHEVIADDVWSVALTYSDGHPLPVTYTATVDSGDTSKPTNSAKLSSVADKLVTAINGGAGHNFIAINDEGTLVITHPDEAFTTLATVDQDSKVTDNNVTQSSVIEFNNDLIDGETWTFTLTNSTGANSRTYTITSATDNETTFAAIVADEIRDTSDDSDDTAYYAAVADGDKVYITSPAGTLNVTTSRAQTANTATVKTLSLIHI